MAKKNEEVIVDAKVDNEKTKDEELNEIVDNEEINDDNLDEKDKQIKSLEETIEKLSKEIDLIKKAAADITNRNKQMEIDKKYASSFLIKQLLVPMSYFEGALKFESEDEHFVNFLKGFEMIYNLLLDQLCSDGLKEIEANVGDIFNPHYHEVSEVIEVEDSEPDKLVEIVQKGFLYKDRVIRPVQVKVSKQKVFNNEDENQTEDNDSVIN